MVVVVVDVLERSISRASYDEINAFRFFFIFICILQVSFLKFMNITIIYKFHKNVHERTNERIPPF